MDIQYRHTPIPSPRSIRVIHLEPLPVIDALPANNTGIHCRLEIISLDDYSDFCADYTALSYSWDAQIPTQRIDCRDGYLLVTPNCEAALRSFRDSKKMETLWIDSICIDQGDDALEERSQQVSLMGEIYKFAKRVVVWIGESDGAVQLALEQIVSIGTVPENISHNNRRRIQREMRERVERMGAGK
jgi:hypothetical protein